MQVRILQRLFTYSPEIRKRNSTPRSYFSDKQVNIVVDTHICSFPMTIAVGIDQSMSYTDAYQSPQKSQRIVIERKLSSIDHNYRGWSKMGRRNSVSSRFQNLETLRNRAPQLDIQPFLRSHTHMAIISVPEEQQ